jgi:hypothetical protein
MKKKQTVEADPLDREIDFSKARPNPYFLAFHSPRQARVLDRDLAEIFPDNTSVNSALRTIAEAAEHTRKRRISARRATVRRRKD